MGAPVQVGQILGGKYEIEKILAQGGIGLVVKGRDVRTQKACAIKLLLPEALETPLARERFLREARACAQVKSDYVVEILDVGETDEAVPYLVLEYLPARCPRGRRRSILSSSARRWPRRTRGASSTATSSRATSSWRGRRTGRSGSSSSTSVSPSCSARAAATARPRRWRGR
jgi:serine/threonine protein kinase